LALTCSCGPSARPADSPESEPASESSATVDDPHETSAQNESPSPLPDDPAAAEATAAPSEPASGYDLDEWAYQHRIQVDIVANGCEAPELGSSPKDYIWCFHHSEKAQTVVYTRARYTARGKKMVKLVEIPVAVALLENTEAPRPESERYSVKLQLTRSDKTHVRLEEVSGFDCAKAKKENLEDKAAAPALYKELAGGIEQVCRQRVTWTFAGGTLRRTGP